MITSEKPKSRLLANAPLCSRCNTTVKMRTLRPGRKVDIVAYRCEECSEEIVVEVKRVWSLDDSVGTQHEACRHIMPNRPGSP